MDLSIFLKDDGSGKLFREKYLLKHHNEEFEWVIDYCKSRGLDNLKFVEKVYLSFNNIESLPKCKFDGCENITGFLSFKKGFRDYCSVRCAGSHEKLKELKKNKSLEKWGTEYPSQSIEVKEKIIKTNNKKWGGNSPMSSELIKEKSRKTLYMNWGVENPSKNLEILSKRIESFKKSNFKENFKKSSLEKWGVNHPWEVEENHKKTRTWFYKDYENRIRSLIGDDYIFLGFKKDLYTNLEFTCNICGDNFTINNYQFYWRINRGHTICTKCVPISKNRSFLEDELFNYIKDVYDGDIIRNYRNKLEIDIYLPELNLGFEFNGIWWHSEKFKNPNDHKDKNDWFRSLGINVFTIWEDDWVTKMNICKSFIKNKLNIITEKVPARKCNIKRVGYKESRTFLNDNHFQGDCKSSIRLGLYWNKKLVSLMTFSKGRSSVGQKFIEGEWELTRFCSLNFNKVVGGASKLLKYFISNFNVKKIISYSDNSISNGDLYSKIGFEFVHSTKPGYWYLVNGKREHRFNWKKSKLVKMGFSSEKTEEEIMMELGHYRIYNYGMKRWELLL